LFVGGSAVRLEGHPDHRPHFHPHAILGRSGLEDRPPRRVERRFVEPEAGLLAGALGVEHPPLFVDQHLDVDRRGLVHPLRSRGVARVEPGGHLRRRHAGDAARGHQVAVLDLLLGGCRGHGDRRGSRRRRGGWLLHRSGHRIGLDRRRDRLGRLGRDAGFGGGLLDRRRYADRRRRLARCRCRRCRSLRLVPLLGVLELLLELLDALLVLRLHLGFHLLAAGGHHLLDLGLDLLLRRAGRRRRGLDTRRGLARGGRRTGRRLGTVPEEPAATGGEEHDRGEADEERRFRRARCRGGGAHAGEGAFADSGRFAHVARRPCGGGHGRSGGDRRLRQLQLLLRLHLLALPLDLIAEEVVHEEGEVEGGGAELAVDHQLGERLVPGGRVGDPLVAGHQALLEQADDGRRQRRAFVGQGRGVDGHAVPVGRQGGEALSGEQLEEDGTQGPHVVGLRQGSAVERLGRQVLADLRSVPAAGRERAQAGSHLEAEQPRFAFVRDHHQVRHHEAVLHPLVLHPRLIGRGEGERDPLGDQQRMVGGQGGHLLRRLGEDGGEALARDVVVRGIREAAHLPQVGTAADVRAAQGLLHRRAAGDLLPQLLAVHPLAVEDAEQDHLVDALLPHPAGTERLSEWVLCQFLEKQILPKLLRDVHYASSRTDAPAASGSGHSWTAVDGWLRLSLDTPAPRNCQRRVGARRLLVTCVAAGSPRSAPSWSRRLRRAGRRRPSRYRQGRRRCRGRRRYGGRGGRGSSWWPGRKRRS